MKDRENGTKETTLMEEKEAEVAVAAISISPSSNYAMTNNSSFTPTTRLSRQTHHRPPGAFAMRPGASGSGVAAAASGAGNTSSSALSSFFHGLRPSHSARGARNRAVHTAGAAHTTFDDDSSSSSFAVGSHAGHHGTASDVHIVPVAQLVSPQHGIAYDVEIAQEVYHGVSVPHPNAHEAAVTPAPEPDGIFWTAPHDGMKASATAAFSKRSRRLRHTNANRQSDNGTGGWFSVRCIAYLALVLGLILATVYGLYEIIGIGSSGSNNTTTTATMAPASQSTKKYPRYPFYNGHDKDSERNKTPTMAPTSDDDNGTRNSTDASTSSNNSSSSSNTTNATSNAEPMTPIEQELPAFSNSSNSSTNATTNNATSSSTSTAAAPGKNATTTANASTSPSAPQKFNEITTVPTASPSISPSSLPTEDNGENTAFDQARDDSPSFDNSDNNDNPVDTNNEPGGDNLNGTDNGGNGPNDQQGPTDNGNQKDKRNGS